MCYSNGFGIPAHHVSKCALETISDQNMICTCGSENVDYKPWVRWLNSCTMCAFVLKAPLLEEQTVCGQCECQGPYEVKFYPPSVGPADAGYWGHCCCLVPPPFAQEPPWDLWEQILRGRERAGEQVQLRWIPSDLGARESWGGRASGGGQAAAPQ